MREIDLHYCPTLADALEQLEHELFFVFQKKETLCRVIHGIGEGILAAAVHDALAKNPLVKTWTEDEYGGSCLVWLLVA